MYDKIKYFKLIKIGKRCLEMHSNKKLMQQTNISEGT